MQCWACRQETVFLFPEQEQTLRFMPKQKLTFANKPREIFTGVECVTTGPTLQYIIIYKVDC